jgi:hypothetical protein
MVLGCAPLNPHKSASTYSDHGLPPLAVQLLTVILDQSNSDP